MRSLGYGALLLLQLLVPFVCFGKNTLDSLWETYKNHGLDEFRKVDILFTIEAIYNGKHLPSMRDSVQGLAMEAALMSGNEKVMVQFYKRFFQFDSAYYHKNAHSYSTQMLNIAKQNNNNDWLYLAYAAIANINKISNQFTNALENSGKAYYYANQNGDAASKIEATLLYGSCLELNNRKTEAFRSYMDALYEAEQLRNESLVWKCYHNLSTFYNLLGRYDKAKFYKIKQVNLTARNKVVDSLKLSNLKIELASILFKNGESIYAEKLFQSVLEYSHRNKQDPLKKQAFTVYRSSLLSNGQFDKLSDLYTKKYPDELRKISKEDTTQFYRLSAFIHEANNKMDSAHIFYSLAEGRILKEETGQYALSTFYKRYGQFLLRRHDLPGAKDKLEKAYKYAEQVDYLPFMIEEAQLLDSTHTLLNQMDKAYYYAKLNHELTQRLASTAKEDELLRLEIDNETRKIEMEKQREEQQIDRRHNIQYMGLTLGITISFIILAMLGSFKVHRAVIKGMGFFTFIFFFEFIILLADNQIHHATHGEPWKIMAIKIVLIGILLPLHHYLEEKVVHYLSHHRLIDTSRIKLRWLHKKPKPVPETPKEEMISDN